MFKKLIIVLLLIYVGCLNLIGQAYKNIFYVPNATATFLQTVPAQSMVFNYGTNELWKLTASGSTVTTLNTATKVPIPMNAIDSLNLIKGYNITHTDITVRGDISGDLDFYLSNRLSGQSAQWGVDALNNSGYIAAFASDYYYAPWADKVVTGCNSNSSGYEINAGFANQTFNLNAGNNANQIYIPSSGNIGFGTNAPTKRFDFNGVLRGRDTIITDVAIKFPDGTYQTTASVGGSGWSLTGNSGTTAGTNFIGTTDAKDLVFKTNNSEVLRLTNTTSSMQGGVGSYVSGGYSFAYGEHDTVSGYYATAIGYHCKASSTSSFSGGYSSKSSNSFAFSYGQNCTAGGFASSAIGTGCKTYGLGSHAEGSGTTAYGSYGHAEGSSTTAYGSGSHAEGSATYSRGDYSHSGGIGTKSKSFAQTAIGSYNDTTGVSSATSFVSTDPIFTVGIGTSNSNRKTTFNIKKNGDTHINHLTVDTCVGCGGGSATSTSNRVDIIHNGEIDTSFYGTYAINFPRFFAGDGDIAHVYAGDYTDTTLYCTGGIKCSGLAWEGGTMQIDEGAKIDYFGDGYVFFDISYFQKPFKVLGKGQFLCRNTDSFLAGYPIKTSEPFVFEYDTITFSSDAAHSYQTGYLYNIDTLIGSITFNGTVLQKGRIDNAGISIINYSSPHTSAFNLKGDLIVNRNGTTEVYSTPNIYFSAAVNNIDLNTSEFVLNADPSDFAADDTDTALFNIQCANCVSKSPDYPNNVVISSTPTNKRCIYHLSGNYDKVGAQALGKGTIDASSAYVKYLYGNSNFNGGIVDSSQVEIGTNVLPDVYQGTPRILRGVQYNSSVTGRTTFTVPIGYTEDTNLYNVNISALNSLSSAQYYIGNKTTTTFDVIYITPLTGDVFFTWALIR